MVKKKATYGEPKSDSEDEQHEERSLCPQNIPQNKHIGRWKFLSIRGNENCMEDVSFNGIREHYSGDESCSVSEEDRVH